MSAVAATELASRVHERLLDALDLRRHDVVRMTDAQLRDTASAMIAQILRETALPAGIDRQLLQKQVLDEALGLGPLEDLLADDDISEIMVNGPRQIFVERAGRISCTALNFSSDKALYAVIERILVPTGRRLDEASPMVDARLTDGSRVNAVIPPLALQGPVITIRKFARCRLQLQDLLARHSLSAPMAEFLTLAIRSRRNIVVSGGTGSGKTTLLNVLSTLIPAGERLVTIEDAAELQLQHANLVNLEARPKNLEGRGEVTIRNLVRNALRMRPDRIIVGECRGGEALDMLQAMNTGHDGSLTTAHANSPRDLLSRLEIMVLMAGMDLPAVAVREQIASAIHLIVQQSRFACGARKLSRITEVTGTESGRIQTQDLFRFVRTGSDAAGRVRGHFAACGHVPTFYEELAAAGVRPSIEIFEERKPPATVGTAAAC